MRPDANPSVSPAGANTHPRRDTRLLRVLGTSRYAVGIAVLGTFVAATALLVHGASEVLHLLHVVFDPGDGQSTATGASPAVFMGVAVVDTFLVAIMLYVFAIGFYQLFFHPLPLPAWLVVEDLAALEVKLVGVVVSALGVVFLGQMVTWDGQRDLMGAGVATSLVIGALTYFIGHVTPGGERGVSGSRTREPEAGDHTARGA